VIAARQLTFHKHVSNGHYFRKTYNIPMTGATQGRIIAIVVWVLEEEEQKG